MKQIKWKTVNVDITKIKATPNNFKLKTEEGLSRFKKSVEKFGFAGAVILNTDYTLIDGNTRVEEAKKSGLKKIDASMPDRKLTAKEFVEFAAMYDLARAGEVDVLRIKNELGTSEQFFKDWGFTMPAKALEKLKELEAAESSVVPTAKGEKKITAAQYEMSRITLSFQPAEAEQYIKLAESLYKRFKVDNVTDLSLAALKFISKLK